MKKKKTGKSLTNYCCVISKKTTGKIHTEKPLLEKVDSQ